MVIEPFGRILAFAFRVAVTGDVGSSDVTRSDAVLRPLVVGWMINETAQVAPGWTVAPSQVLVVPMRNWVGSVPAMVAAPTWRSALPVLRTVKVNGALSAPTATLPKPWVAGEMDASGWVMTTVREDAVDPPSSGRREPCRGP